MENELKHYITLFIKIAKLPPSRSNLADDILPIFNQSNFKKISGWFDDTFDEIPYGATAETLYTFYENIAQGIVPDDSQSHAHAALAGYFLCQTKCKKPFEIIRLKNKSLTEKTFDNRIQLKAFARYPGKRQYKLDKNLFQDFVDIIIAEEKMLKQEEASEINKPLNYFYKIDIQQIPVKTSAESFYNGHPPTMEDIASDFDHVRYLYKEENKSGIKYTIKEIINKGLAGLNFIRIHGTAGCGRTTILKRLALDFTKENYNVYYLNERDNNRKNTINITDEVLQLISNKNCLIIIDDLFLNESLDIRYLMSKFCSSNSIVIFSEHSGIWERVNSNVKRLLSGKTIKHFLCDKLDPNEIDEFAKKITSLENDGKILKKNFNLSTEEKANLCRELADSRLFIAMMQLRYGEPFHIIVKAECENIITKNFLKEIYKTICFFNSIHIALPESLIDRAYDSLEYIDVSSLIGNILLRDKTGQLLKARHFLIAQEVFTIYREDRNENYNQLYKLISNIDLRRFIKDEIHFYNEFLENQKASKMFAVLLGYNKGLIIRFYDELSIVLKDKEFSLYFRLSFLKFMGNILRVQLGAHAEAEKNIYCKLDKINFHNYIGKEKEREKQIILSLMMDRINNQFQSGNVESAIILGDDLIKLVRKYLVPEKQSYFLYNYGRMLRFCEIKEYFLRAGDYFELFRKIKKNNISSRQKKEIQKYQKQKDKALNNEFENSKTFILRDEEYILLKNELVHKILKRKREVETIDLVNRDATIAWAKENLEEGQIINFYSNLGRIIYRFKISGLNIDIENAEIDEYFQMALQHDKAGTNESLRMYYAEFLKDINGQEENALKYIDHVVNFYSSYEGLETRKKLYNEGYACYVKASLIYKHRNFFKNKFSLLDADSLAFKALSNFEVLLAKHIMGIEIRLKDYSEKYVLVKDLIAKIGKANFSSKV